MLTDPQQYGPILAWLEQRRIQLDVNHHAIDTTGFFDEIAMQLGDRYDTLKLVVNQIKYVQQRTSYDNVKLALSNHSSKQIAVITRFCKELHEYSFVARYDYRKKDKIMYLKLQKMPAIVKFFNGEWMEWFVFMKLLAFFRKRQISVACLRNLSITFSNKDIHELDVFFLINDTLPLCVECKTGEFRGDIAKCSRLRKRLHLDKSQFLICAIGLSQEQIQGFNSMYDVTFANETGFLQHVEQLIG